MTPAASSVDKRTEQWEEKGPHVPLDVEAVPADWCGFQMDRTALSSQEHVPRPRQATACTQTGSVQLLQLGLQGLEVPDGVLERGGGTQRLELHQVPADVVQTHVSEAPSVIGGDSAGVIHVS